MTVVNKAVVGTIICLFGIGGVWLLDYLAIYRPEPVAVPGAGRMLDSVAQTPSTADVDSDVSSYAQPFVPAAELNLSLEAVVEGLEIPWSIVFTSPDRMLVTERPGRIREVVNEQLSPTPLLVIDEVLSNTGEIGLMGMVAHPEYAQNSLLYACYGYVEDNGTFNKVVQLIDQDDRVEVGETIIERLPSARNHAGCELAISPDQKLFVTVGDALVRDQAQNLDSLAGKILRLNLDGSVPDDNPFADSPIYSYGHRNPQGLAWHPDSGELYSTEHGPSVFDGPAGGDEVNLLRPGVNYGWPVISHEQTRDGMETGLVVYTPAVAPATASFYDADLLPELQNSFLFAGLRGEGLYRVVFGATDSEEVIAYEQFPQVDLGRVRVVQIGPDGAIYLATSNRDGRGTVRGGDDKIMRLSPR